MNRRDRKLAILRQLGLESEPITLYELSNAFEFNYSTRTIRRLLNELIEEGLVKRSGSTRGAKYVAVKATDRILNQEPIIPPQDVNHISSCFGSKSLNAIEKIKKIPPKITNTYLYSVFFENPPMKNKKKETNNIIPIGINNGILKAFVNEVPDGVISKS